MARKRRKRRNITGPSTEWESADSDTIDEDEPKFVPRLILTEEVPGSRITDRSFRPAGIVCRRCGWMTKKIGTNGRQALRGHYRIHAREDQAARRTLLRHLAILLIAGLATAIVTVGVSGLVL